MSESLTFVKNRPVDKSDPGFTIPGKTLRWVSARVSENNPGRPWVILRKSVLTKELITHLEGINPNAFALGDTIRKGDLVLAVATKEAHKLHRKELDEKARGRESSVNRFTRGINNPDGSSRAKVETNEDRDVTREMLAKFKASSQD